MKKMWPDRLSLLVSDPGRGEVWRVAIWSVLALTNVVLSACLLA